MPLPTVTIFGNINKIETRFTQSGMQVTSFSIECDEKNKKGEWENLYLKASVFDKSAAFVSQYFNDGDLCVATGKLVTEVYEGSDGKKKYEIKLKFPQIEFAPKAKGESKPTGANAPVSYERKDLPKNNVPEIDIDSETIPF